MTSVGIQRLSPSRLMPKWWKPLIASADAERDREQDHRERPDDVEEARDHPVGPAAVVAGEQREDHGDETQIIAEPMPTFSELSPP